MSTDTPRTDAEWQRYVIEGHRDAGQHFAANLERELNDTNAVALRYAHEIDRLKEEIEQHDRIKEEIEQLVFTSSYTLAQAQIDKLIARIGKHEAALRKIVELTRDELVAEIARAAINRTEGKP